MNEMDCPVISPIEVAALAYQEVTGEEKPLGLTDFDPEKVKTHLKEGCETCGRWYKNAKRPYQKLLRERRIAEAASAAVAALRVFRNARAEYRRLREDFQDAREEYQAAKEELREAEEKLMEADEEG